MTHSIRIKDAKAHNLRGVSLSIPHNKLVVITGVSGSGKSSLAFDTVCREGQRRYLESFSSRARQMLGKLGKTEVESIENLRATVALDQKSSVRNPRSTVGTMSELNSHLRLLLAREGKEAAGAKVSRSDLSFNSTGACPACQGLGVQDVIDPELLIADPSKTLREGALVITTDSGYIIYSQVTMEVLNQVCQAHDFDVDIPWQEMNEDQRRVILYGSDRIEIPFGKHTLESRMKWSGITARPRQTGKYGGIVPVMEQILRRDRNKNILRFARTVECLECGGTRLNERARGVEFAGRSLADYCAMSVDELHQCFEAVKSESSVVASVRAELLNMAGRLQDLGLGYLTLDRSGPSLSGGEAQRIRLATMVGSKLRGMTYVLDEPSLGLHPRDQQRLLRVLRQLVDQGNTVIAVEHDRQTMLAADWLIDLGPGAGVEGGHILFEGSPQELLEVHSKGDGPTAEYLRGQLPLPTSSGRQKGAKEFLLPHARLNNLRDLEVPFLHGGFNVVSGVSGAGKSSLLEELAAHSTAGFAKTIVIDQKPIGRTPRSNPATYTKLFDQLRTLFAAEPQAKRHRLSKGTFSFNTKGGRCPECEGAGVKRLGMHFLGDVEITCQECGGRRYRPEVLQVTHRGLNMSQVLALSVREAAELFAEEPKVSRMLNVLVELGLGYLTLGQPSTTLSGGEAQRIKLASDLGRPRTKDTLYILDEPTAGLHAADVVVLLKALDKLVSAGGTVVVSEHHEAFLRFADRVIDLGPDSGEEGGKLVYVGPPAGLLEREESITGQMLLQDGLVESEAGSPVPMDPPIRLRGVRTHNLKNVEVDIPVGKISVITGVSGSGKSSLAMDTLHAEGQARYAENFSTYIRQQLASRARPDFDAISGLTPTIAIGQQSSAVSARSTVATMVEVHPLLRLMYSRVGTGWQGPDAPTAGAFSFNNHEGACPQCHGLGHVTAADAEKLVTHPERSLLAGALDGHKTGRFYGEPEGQYVATLKEVGRQLGMDFGQPWNQLTDRQREVSMHGTGDVGYEVTWEYERGKNKGRHEFTGLWAGFCGLVNEEYARKQEDKRGKEMLSVMSQDPCPSCAGQRHGPEVLQVQCAGMNIAQLCALSVNQVVNLFGQRPTPMDQLGQLCDEAQARLVLMQEVGLGYLTLDRATRTLSSGERRRLQLVRQIGVQLCGLTCVLDEPTQGLHPQDTEGLWRVITRLRDQGNTVVLVEHDPDVIRRCDHIIDLGPAAGSEGGQVVAAGSPEEIMANPDSVTGPWLKEMSVEPQALEVESSGPAVKISAAHCHNLRDVDVRFPTGAMTAVVGVSGSGKSSLVFGTLAASADRCRPVNCAAVSGLEHFEQVIDLGSQVLQGSALSSPLTATGLAAPLRKLMAGTEKAKALGLKAGQFSTTQKGGRCEKCQGTGQIKVALDFLADVTSLCPECDGQAFQAHVLECRYSQLNIAGIMGLSIGEAVQVFSEEKSLASGLQVLADAGLSYLSLGQSTATMSGGEKQRLQLACGLLMGKNKNTAHLYLCDEPTSGLHMADVDHLARLLRRLTDAGHTVIFTEHNAQLIAAADHVVRLGPGAGDDGGQVI